MIRSLLLQKCSPPFFSLLFPFIISAPPPNNNTKEEEEDHGTEPPLEHFIKHLSFTLTPPMEIETHLPPLHPNFPHVTTTCPRHPDQHFTGFCASCLRERLAGLETRKPTTSSSSSSSSALKSIFFKTHHELRRCKSFSGPDGFSGPRPFEPQRKSCDVRGRSTLWSLFHQDDKGPAEIEIPPIIAAPVIEDEIEEDEIRPAEPITSFDSAREIMEEKTMKVHIDLETQIKKPTNKELTGTFWLAASVFSKKLQKWRRKQKMKKGASNVASIQPEKTQKSSRRFRETQSEIAVDAFGRRSCDIDHPRFSLDAGRMSVDNPRFSLDAGRMSVDNPRFSWDAPRASWDGHLIGGRSMFAPPPPMVAVGEDTHVAPVERWDGRIPVEEDAAIPGGSIQTRDYYLDSSSSRRRSLDRSNSVRKQSFEFSELKPVSNAKVSPAGGKEFFHAPNGIKLERDSRDLSSNSLRYDRAESFESAFRDPQKGGSKSKSRRWSKAWSIWGFIYRRGGSRGGAAGNEAERTFSGSLPEQVYNGKIFRSNSSVSLRSSMYNNPGFGSMRRSNVEANAQVKRRNGEFMLERSRSARYSPSHVDNGMLRFYLTPMQGSRRNGFAGRSRHSTASCSVTKTALGMY